MELKMGRYDVLVHFIRFWGQITLFEKNAELYVVMHVGICHNMREGQDPGGGPSIIM